MASSISRNNFRPACLTHTAIEIFTKMSQEPYTDREVLRHIARTEMETCEEKRES